MEKSEQPPEFVGWWEVMFYTRGGQSRDTEGIIERIHSDGRFEAYRNGVRLAAGRHVDFHTGPPGFTNVQQDHHLLGASARELAIYRFVGQTLEICKAPERDGRPDRFESVTGTSVVHVAIRRISDKDPRILNRKPSFRSWP